MGRKLTGLRAVEGLLARIAKICTFISGVCLITLVVAFGWLVFGRYVLNATPTWVEQLALLLVAVITFLSSAVGVSERTHLSVEILPSMLPASIRSKLRLLISLILGGFGLVMVIEAYNLTVFNWTTEIPLLGVPEGLRTIPLVVSGVLLLLFSIGHILREVTAQGRDIPGGSTETTHRDDERSISQENV